ncbi:BgTH12-04823 [Blumeria graminis f. sp. triticale]|uniref:BgTH12-04823 n=1 Tax=Blumeria graminis f. sp. triticale TaxID=1689686 RepID=A0A9W4CVD9_BLUGR|nr:BgTH12-04823 [Blumeria graminis f. sp. triticale]
MMRIAPPTTHSDTFTHLPPSSRGAPSAPGVHDLIRAGVGPTQSQHGLSSAPDSAHPLETRLKKWEETQEALKMEGLRRTFGMAEPIRRGMELKMTRDGHWKPACLGGGTERSIHEDILMGNDTSCQWEDIYKGDETRRVPGFHEELEQRVRMA